MHIVIIVHTVWKLLQCGLTSASHTAWKNEEFTATQIFFLSVNQSTVKFFSKTLIWRKICEKTAVKFRNFHRVSHYTTVEISEFYSQGYFAKIRQINALLKNFTRLIWREKNSRFSSAVCTVWKFTEFSSTIFILKFWNFSVKIKHKRFLLSKNGQNGI